jgi:hypothetical protein
MLIARPEPLIEDSVENRRMDEIIPAWLVEILGTSCRFDDDPVNHVQERREHFWLR